MYYDINPKRNVREHTAIGNDPISYVQTQETRLTRTGEFKGKYILAAIDGTGSEGWREEDGSNSHIFKFYQDFDVKGGEKEYFHGPNNIVFGGDSSEIMQKVLTFIDREILQHIISKFPEMGSLSDLKNELRICLIGHSRGGLIAINVASRLIIPVYFMGLYDAVDRTWDMDGAEISNTLVAYHAIRDRSIGSRTSFGNDGLSSKGGIYKEEYFVTSHGGIGGDAVAQPSSRIKDDWSCSSEARYYIDKDGEVHNFPTKYTVQKHNYNATHWHKLGDPYAFGLIPPTNLPLADQLTHPLCVKGSEESDEWIRNGAKLYGLPIP